MLHKAKALKGFKLQCRDGEIGSVSEFYFDDRHWAIRYLVANTGSWLTGRKVLISPYALLGLDSTEQRISVDLTQKQIEDSPPLSSHVPVSRHFEESYFGFYGWPVYWGGPFMWGASPYLLPKLERESTALRPERAWDAHLRSTHDMSGHDIEARDGALGHIEDFIVDDETWAIRYLVIDTQNWWPSKHVLISPHWIQGIDWEESKVFVDLSRDAIKQSPEYTLPSLPSRDFEAKLHRHYMRSPYWADDPLAKK